MSFTTVPCLDKMITDKCSKSVKASDQSFSRIQALFLDAVEPLSGMLDSINKGTKLAVEDVEDAVKATLKFPGECFLSMYLSPENWHTERVQ